MDYEKKLKDALDDKLVPVEVQEWIEETFPELVESEDERIRKVITDIVKAQPSDSLFNGTKEKCLAWLEKQSKDSPVFSNSSNIGKIEQKPAYTKEYDFHGIKFIPKFAKGDIIKDKKRGEVSTIEDFSYDTGLYTHTYGQFPITIQDNYEIIEQKPAEDRYMEGYLNGINDASKTLKPAAWSEEDEKQLNDIIRLLPELDIRHNWLKSLKDRVQPVDKDRYMEGYMNGMNDAIKRAEPAEWSEEDRRMLIGLIDELDAIMNKATPNEISVYSKYINWLKSLRPQNTWKPSQEQLGIIAQSIAVLKVSGYGELGDRLGEISEQLNKLKEE